MKRLIGKLVGAIAGELGYTFIKSDDLAQLRAKLATTEQLLAAEVVQHAGIIAAAGKVASMRRQKQLGKRARN